ncbi:hypothetical protein AHAS_Ahas12G0062400 [Arachis hypogaea]
MSKEFWTETDVTTVHILNRCPIKSVRDKTLKEIWSGKLSSLHHFRVFECIIYTHIPDQLKKKLDNKDKKCIFIDYSTNSKAYKLYNLKSKKVIINKKVTFDEKDVVLNCKNKKQSTVISTVRLFKEQKI